MEENTSLEFIRRVNEADLRIPIIAVVESRKWIPLDGYHRVCKGVKTRRTFIQVREITEDQLKQALIKPGDKLDKK